MRPEERIRRLKATRADVLAARERVAKATRRFVAEVEAAKDDPEHPLSYNRQAKELGTSRQALEQQRRRTATDGPSTLNP